MSDTKALKCKYCVFVADGPNVCMRFLVQLSAAFCVRMKTSKILSNFKLLPCKEISLIY